MPHCSQEDMPKIWNESMAPQKGLCHSISSHCSFVGIIRTHSCWWTQVKSIQRQISSLTASLDSNNAEARANAQAEIDRLQQELTNVCAGVVSRGSPEEHDYALRSARPD
jgi:hypothetical protein